MTDLDLPAVLAIAGVDPTGGAGLFADFETFDEFHVRGLGVVAALTAQNQLTFTGAFPIGGDVLRAEIDGVCEDETIAAVKIGMLGDADNVATVVGAIHHHRLRNVVVDPVLRSTSGGELLTPDGIVALRDLLFPLATLITPNASEAGVLLGRPAPRDLPEMREAANALLRFGSASVLVKGGHVDESGNCVDVLASADGIMELGGDRVDGPGIRGSGCRLSSAIAAGLAHGQTVCDACFAAKAHVAWLIARGTRRDFSKVETVR